MQAMPIILQEHSLFAFSSSQLAPALHGKTLAYCTTFMTLLWHYKPTQSRKAIIVTSSKEQALQVHRLLSEMNLYIRRKHKTHALPKLNIACNLDEAGAEFDLLVTEDRHCKKAAEALKDFSGKVSIAFDVDPDRLGKYTTDFLKNVHDLVSSIKQVHQVVGVSHSPYCISNEKASSLTKKIFSSRPFILL